MTAVLEPSAAVLDTVDPLAPLRAGPDGRTFTRLYDIGETRPGQPMSTDLYDLAVLLCRQITDDAAVIAQLKGSALGPVVSRLNIRPAALAALVRTARVHVPTVEPVANPTETEPLDITVAELAKNPALLQGPEAVSPWLVWRGQLSLLIGREKLAGKSTFAASDAVRAAKAGHTVLWVDAEQGHTRVVSRFVELGAPLDRLVTLRRWPQSWAEVEDVITRRQPAAIYVDSVSSFLMAVEGKVPDNSEGEKWQALVGRFKRWTMLGAADAGVCGLLHATKADGSYRGSTGIGAAPDVMLTMRADPDDQARRWLDCIGRWGFPSRCVRFEGEAKGYSTVDGVVLPAALGPKISETRRKVLNALGPGMAWSTWRDAFGGSKDTFSTAVRWLREQGYVKLDDSTGAYNRDEFTVSQAA